MIKLQPFWWWYEGSTNLVSTTAYQEYFAFLTVYSDTIFSENIAFKIWDASQGKVIVATMRCKYNFFFEENGVLDISQPAILKLESGGAKNINKRMDVGIDECD
jgi:choline kinase